jgi:hypothetical protein
VWVSSVVVVSLGRGWCGGEWLYSTVLCGAQGMWVLLVAIVAVVVVIAVLVVVVVVRLLPSSVGPVGREGGGGRYARSLGANACQRPRAPARTEPRKWTPTRR